jgi:hypothetical protein
VLNKAPASLDPTLAAPQIRAGRTIDVVVDGTESDNGRALYVISALHGAASALLPARVWVLAPSSESVSVAAEALAWDTGLSVVCLPADPDFAIVKTADVILTASTWEPNWPFLTVAYRAGKNPITVVQFPRLAPEMSAHFPYIRSAHDTTVLASRIATELAILRA